MCLVSSCTSFFSDSCRGANPWATTESGASPKLTVEVYRGVQASSGGIKPVFGLVGWLACPGQQVPVG